MNILRKLVTVILVALIIFTLTINIQIKTIATLSLNSNIGRVTNVAVIMYSLDQPYIIKLRESLENIEKESKNNVKFTFYDAKYNIAIQNEILDSALKDNFDLFILNLADKRKNIVEDVINKVKQKNLPLILMNIDPEVVSEVSKLYNKVAFITPDSKQAGIAQGKIIIDLWNSKKAALDKNGDKILQYVLLQGPSDDPQTIDRTRYAISTINDAGIKTQQLELIHANWLQELAKSSIDNLFLKYSSKIEAIISNNDAMAIGAIEALQKYGYNKGNKSKNIAVFGIDGLPKAKDLIDKGFMNGTIIQDPNVHAEAFYKIGMNLINNLNPIENTNYNIVNGEIIIPFPYDAYIGKSNNA